MIKDQVSKLLNGSAIDRNVKWIDPQFHRSSRSGITNGVKKFEGFRKGKHIRTTYLNYSRTGASISDGILFPQHNYKNKPSQIDDAISNIDDGTKKADAILISTGANDVGWSETLINLATRVGDNRDPSGKTHLELALENLDKKLVDLYDKFIQLDKKLRSELLDSSGKIFITEYPIDIFTALDSKNQLILKADCGFFEILGMNSISKSEVNQLFQMGVKLNNKLKEFAEKLNWIYIGDIQSSFSGHGYCSSDTFWVGAEESCLNQDNFMGMLHPNSSGHEIIGDAVAKSLKSNL